MKNKKALYILLPLVLLVWGLIILRIIKQVKSTPNGNYYRQQVVNIDDSEEIKLDTFTIIANYRDPFLGRVVIVRQQPTRSMVKTRSEERPVRRIRNRSIRWPSIAYNGVITNENKTNDVALISINNVNYLMKIGDVNQEVTLLMVYPDSVRLQYQEVTKSYTKVK